MNVFMYQLPEIPIPAWLCCCSFISIKKKEKKHPLTDKKFPPPSSQTSPVSHSVVPGA